MAAEAPILDSPPRCRDREQGASTRVSAVIPRRLCGGFVGGKKPLFINSKEMQWEKGKESERKGEQADEDAGKCRRVEAAQSDGSEVDPGAAALAFPNCVPPRPS